MSNEFQYRLQKSIANAGVSASELSKMTGISEANISNYINGKYVAKQDKVYLMARALNVDPGWLMTGFDPSRKELAEESAILTAYRNADEGTRSAVRKLLDVK